MLVAYSFLISWPLGSAKSQMFSLVQLFTSQSIVCNQTESPLNIKNHI